MVLSGGIERGQVVRVTATDHCCGISPGSTGYVEETGPGGWLVAVDVYGHTRHVVLSPDEVAVVPGGCCAPPRREPDPAKPPRAWHGSLPILRAAKRANPMRDSEPPMQAPDPRSGEAT